MNLRCQKNHPRAACESGQTAHTARYTQPFARRVVDVLQTGEVWSLVAEELGKEVAAVGDEAPEEMRDEEEVSEEERQEIDKRYIGIPGMAV